MKAEVFVAHAKYWAWWILSKLVIGVICLGIIAEGLRLFFPFFGQKLHKLPLLSFLKNYQETAKLDYAPFIALIFMLSVWMLLESLIKRFVFDEKKENDKESWFIIGAAVILIGADCLLFYSAIGRMQWGQSSIAVSSIIGTIAYLGVLIFISYLAVKLWKKVEELKKKDEAPDSEPASIILPHIEPQGAVRVL